MRFDLPIATYAVSDINVIISVAEFREQSMIPVQASFELHQSNHSANESNNISLIQQDTQYFMINFYSKSMAMWGNHIQRVKIVINENIIEQGTYFKYLGYCMSEYKRDL